MTTMRARLTVSTSIVLVGCILTLYAGAQPGNGQYPTLPQYPNNGATYVFRPPAGWHRIQSTGIGLGMWMGGPDYMQSIGVRAENYSGTLADYAAGAVNRIRRDHPDAKMSTLQRTTLCSGHPAVYFSWEATHTGGPIESVVYEEMVTIYGGTAYHAYYARALGQPSIPAARTSLTSLCGGNPPGTQTLNGSPIPGAYASPPSPLSPANSPLPQTTYGAAAPTVTPRTSP